MIHVGIDARLRAYRGGGIAEHVARLLAGLRRLEAVAGPEPWLRLTVYEHRRAQRRGLVDEAEDDGPAGAIRRRTLWTPPHHALEGWTLPLEIRRGGRVDLLHMPDVVLPRAWRGPSVITVHDVAFLRRPELLTSESRRFYDGIHRSVARATRVIVVSEHTRRQLIQRTDVDPAKVHVVPNAVARRFRAGDEPGVAAAKDAEVTMRLGLRMPFLLFVSTIEPRKNVPTLLEAFRWLRDAGHELELVLVGADGWKSDAVYDRAQELGLGSSARFLGWVGDADLSALYRRAIALAHPALDEGFGMTPLEAMASGTPVVVSDAGSLPEVVGDAGLRVPPQDSRAWHAALERIVTDRALRQRLSAEGRERAAAFTMRRQAAETAEVYREAAEESEGPR